VSINIRNWPNDFVCVCVCSHSGWDGSSSSSYLVLYPFQSPSYNTLSFHGDVVGIPIKRLDALYAMHFAVLQPITKQQFPFPFPLSCIRTTSLKTCCPQECISPIIVHGGGMGGALHAAVNRFPPLFPKKENGIIM
jgi:hypothetical protein